MRCQYCGKRLPILRKLTDSEFCSPAHRKSFQEEQERQALARLLEASQQAGGVRRGDTPAEPGPAAKPPARSKAAEPARAKGGAPAAPPKRCDSFFRLVPNGARSEFAPPGIRPVVEMRALQLTELLLKRRKSQRERLRLPDAGAVLPLVPSSHHSLPDAIMALSVPLKSPGAMMGPASRPVRFSARPRTVVGLEKLSALRPQPPAPVELTGGRERLIAVAGLRMRRCSFSTVWVPPRVLNSNRMAGALPVHKTTVARAADVEGMKRVAPPAPTFQRPATAVPARAVGDSLVRGMPQPERLMPVAVLLRTAAPAIAKLESLAAETELPPLVKPVSRADASASRRLAGRWLLAVPGPEPAAPPVKLSGAPPNPFAASREALQRPLVRLVPSGATQHAAGLQLLPERFRPQARVLADRGKVLVLTVKARPIAVEVPLATPTLKMANAQPAPRAQAACAAAGPGQVKAINAVAPVMRSATPLLEQDALSMRAVNLGLRSGSPRLRTRMVRWTPNFSGGTTAAELATFDAKWTIALRTMQPRSVLRPEPARTTGKGIGRRRMPFSLRQRSPLGRLWTKAPNDLRWAALAAPLVLLIAWYSLSPGNKRPELPAAIAVGAATPIGLAEAKPAAPPGAVAQFLAPLQEKLAARAAVEVSDDFRNGLSAWEGDRNWAEGWNYDQSGFIQPGSLALLRPTLGLQDYTFEFLGKVQRRALSWVYRAKDTRNYMAGKLVMTQTTPVPVLTLIRYRVVNGREQARKSIPVPQQLRAETLYRIRVDVQGSDFTTSVLGKVVDTFTDATHSEGGVGLFSARGEEAKVRWVEVSHQQDMIGRLCAFLAGPRPTTGPPPAKGQKSQQKTEGR